MSLYLYTNRNVLFAYLERSLIAPASVIQDPHQWRTIGTAAAPCLFVTHHRLNSSARRKGISDPHEFLITLEISNTVPTDGRAVLVKTGPSGVQYVVAPLSEYDEESCIGAFLIGEIPWSRVETVYFDTENDRDQFVRPSPDYWYPTDRYAVLPETFTEEWSFEPDEEPLLTALKSADIDVDTIRQGIFDRERMRAGVLNGVNGTNPWDIGEYRFNVDPALQELLGLEDVAVQKALPHYADGVASLEADKKEDLALFGHGRVDAECEEPDDAPVGVNQQIYDIIIRAFRKTAMDDGKTLGVDVLHAIESEVMSLCKSPREQNIVHLSMSNIEGLVTNTGELTPNEISGDIPDVIDVLKALLYAVKNPRDYDKLVESFAAYQVGQCTRRRAMILWGELNGLVGVPGEGCNKDNRELWQFIENYVDVVTDASITLSVARPEAAIKDGKVLGFSIYEKQTISTEDIRQTIIATRDRLDDAFYEMLLGYVTVRPGAKKDDYKHRMPAKDLMVKAGTELTEDEWNALEELYKACKKKAANREKLFADYVGDKAVFDKVYAKVQTKDPDYWRWHFARDKSKS